MKHNITSISDLPDTAGPVLYIGVEWGAEICLDQDGCVYADTFQKSGGTSADKWHGLTRTWEVPATVKTSALKTLLLKHGTRQLLERVYEGLSWELDARGNGTGGLTEDAAEAEDELTKVFAALSTNEADGDCVNVCSVWDWLCNCWVADLWPSEDTLEKATERLLRSALDDDIWLEDADNVSEVLVQMLLHAYERGTVERLSATQRASLLADAKFAGRLAEIDGEVEED